MTKILIVDDEKDIRELLSDIISDEGYETDIVGHAQAAIDHVDQFGYDMVILDIWLKESHMDGIDILKYIKSRQPQLPVVIISGHGNVEIAVAAIKQGAFDFIEKPFNVDQLLVVVNRALEASALRRKALQSDNDPSQYQIIGDAPATRNFREQLEKVAKSQSRVMLVGPAGSGKEQAARYIHAQSDRADQAFVVVNSALLSSKDLERQLFGYEEGGKIYHGLLSRAHNGTIFFDEIADMPMETQGKILRILNDQRFERQNGSQMINVNIRFLSATTEDLTKRIQAGTFREELYHRLAVIPVQVPSLLKRLDDLPQLVQHFVDGLVQQENLRPMQFSDAAIDALRARQWPGNLRELRNRVEHALISYSGEEDGIIHTLDNPDAASAGPALDPAYVTMPLREARELFEQRYLRAQISRFSGNVSRTAAFIGMERSALHRKMKSLNISGQDSENFA